MIVCKNSIWDYRQWRYWQESTQYLIKVTWLIFPTFCCFLFDVDLNGEKIIANIEVDTMCQGRMAEIRVSMKERNAGLTSMR